MHRVFAFSGCFVRSVMVLSLGGHIFGLQQSYWTEVHIMFASSLRQVVFVLSPCLQNNLHPISGYDFFTVERQRLVLMSSASCSFTILHSPVGEMVAHRAQCRFRDKPEVAVGIYAASNGPSLLS